MTDDALKAAQRIVDTLSSPASLMGGETAILNTKDVGLVARALLTQAERGREVLGLTVSGYESPARVRALKRSGQESGERKDG